nr:MAG TPA: hypothetical protein [Crassvirales sp.]
MNTLTNKKIKKFFLSNSYLPIHFLANHLYSHLR